MCELGADQLRTENTEHCELRVCQLVGLLIRYEATPEESGASFGGRHLFDDDDEFSGGNWVMVHRIGKKIMATGNFKSHK